MKQIREKAKEILGKETQESVKKNMHRAGLYTWVTKSYEAWLLLQSLLYLIRPKKLVEFGSGRSTNYLGEYALKFGAELISFEQNWSYCFKVNLSLKFSFLPSGVVKHAPIKDDWYDLNVVKKHLDTLGDFDFLLLDGPVGFDLENRDSKQFYDTVVPYLNNIKLIVMDDTHYPECDKQARYLSEKFNLKRYDLRYNKENTLGVLLNSQCASLVEELPSFLRELLVVVE